MTTDDDMGIGDGWKPDGWQQWTEEQRRIWRLEQQLLRWEQIALATDRFVQGTYDERANAAYFHFVTEIAPGEAHSRPVQIEGVAMASLVCDFDGEGRLLGLEVQAARKLLREETIQGLRRIG